MILDLSFAIGFMGKFCRGEYAKNKQFIIDLYSRRPCFITITPKSTNKTRFTHLANSWNVLHIFKLIGFSQVRQSIVTWIAINMIYSIGRPMSMNIKPSQTMGVTTMTHKTNSYSSIGGFSSSDVTNFGSSAVQFNPSKQSSIRIVMQELFKNFWGKIGFSHDASYKRIGQRLTRVDSTCGLRHFIIGV